MIAASMPGFPATAPISNRAAVPLLPQSRLRPAALRPRVPVPRTVKSRESAGIDTPHARRTPAVEWTSADSRMSEITRMV